jgi:hypothetical protein
VSGGCATLGLTKAWVEMRGTVQERPAEFSPETGAVMEAHANEDNSRVCVKYRIEKGSRKTKRWLTADARRAKQSGFPQSERWDVNDKTYSVVHLVRGPEGYRTGRRAGFGIRKMRELKVFRFRKIPVASGDGPARYRIVMHGPDAVERPEDAILVDGTSTVYVPLRDPETGELRLACATFPITEHGSIAWALATPFVLPVTIVLDGAAAVTVTGLVVATIPLGSPLWFMLYALRPI